MLISAVIGATLPLGSSAKYFDVLTGMISVLLPIYLLPKIVPPNKYKLDLIAYLALYFLFFIFIINPLYYSFSNLIENNSDRFSEQIEYILSGTEFLLIIIVYLTSRKQQLYITKN